MLPKKTIEQNQNCQKEILRLMDGLIFIFYFSHFDSIEIDFERLNFLFKKIHNLTNSRVH